MSVYQGVYVGIGYLVSAEERAAMLDKVEDVNRKNSIIDNFHLYNVSREEYFLGEKIYEIEEGRAVSVETLAALPALADDGSFGLKYGAILSACGISVEEINTKWGRPNIYMVHWEDC